MTPDLQLAINGTSYGGWKAMRVHLGLEEVSGSFDLEVSEIWPEQLTPREIRTGDRAVVSVDGTVLITGFVDTVNPSYDARSHTFNVRGRDATADLVDCAAVHKKGEWRNADLAQIARDLVGPFGIPVKISGDIGKPFPTFAIEPGETAFACLERAARQRGARLLSDGQGSLLVGTVPPGHSSTALKEGDNLLSASATNDASQRFSEYTVKGQQSGTDDVNGAAAASIKAVATDSAVTRYRPLLILDEDQGDIGGFERRAKWEASVRGARALTVNCTVQGWSHTGGLWRPNTLVQVDAPRIRVQRELLVRDVDLVCDEGGTRTDLVLTPQTAFTLQPPPKGRGKDVLA